MDTKPGTSSDKTNLYTPSLQTALQAVSSLPPFAVVHSLLLVRLVELPAVVVLVDLPAGAGVLAGVLVARRVALHRADRGTYGSWRKRVRYIAR